MDQGVFLFVLPIKDHVLPEYPILSIRILIDPYLKSHVIFQSRWDSTTSKIGWSFNSKGYYLYWPSDQWQRCFVYRFVHMSAKHSTVQYLTITKIWHAAGLVNYCVPTGKAQSKALEVAREINEKVQNLSSKFSI